MNWNESSPLTMGGEERGPDILEIQIRHLRALGNPAAYDVFEQFGIIPVEHCRSLLAS